MQKKELKKEKVMKALTNVIKLEKDNKYILVFSSKEKVGLVEHEMISREISELSDVLNNEGYSVKALYLESNIRMEVIEKLSN